MTVQQDPLVAYGNDWTPPPKRVSLEHVPQLDFTNPYGRLEINVQESVVTDDVAAVVLSVSFAAQNWKVSGSSKRMPGDKPDRCIGYGLALTRALERVTNQIRRQAEGLVKHNDGIKASKHHMKDAPDYAERHAVRARTWSQTSRERLLKDQIWGREPRRSEHRGAIGE